MRGRVIVGVLSLLLVVVGTSSVLAGEAGGFLAVGPGGKVVGGGGGAYAASVVDATAGYWNPAGLARLNSMEFVSTLGELHNSALENRGISVAAPTGIGVVSVTWATLGAEGIPVTELDPYGYVVPTGEFFNVREAINTFSLGRAITDRLAVGVTFKKIDYDFHTARGKGQGWDIGLRYDISEDLSLGVVGQHLATTMKWSSGVSEEINPRVRIGAMARTYKKRLTVATDVDITRWGESTLAWGVAYALGKNLTVRFSKDSDERAQGIGFISGKCEFNYDWVVREGLGYVGYFSTRYQF